MKRLARRVAPRLTDRLRAALIQPVPAVDHSRMEALVSALHKVQNEFNAPHGADDETVAQIAADSTILVAGIAPFHNVALLVDELVSERFVFGELVIVDATAEEPRLVAIRDHVASWSRRLPLTRFRVVPYSRQELRFAEVIQEGWRAASRSYVWVAGRYNVPLNRCFEYLIRAMLAQSRPVVALANTAAEDGRLRQGALDSCHMSGEVGALMRRTDTFDILNGAEAESPDSLLRQPLIETMETFREGIFGGARSVLASESGELLDTRFITDIAVADAALRFHARGSCVVRTAAAVGVSLRAQATDAAAPWEAIHDWRWLIDKRARFVQDLERLELVCPFHRGDVILAVQVAAYAVAVGKNIRLHVAEPLVGWAKEFCPELDIQSIPVPVASAEDTYPQLLRAYRYVSQRDDASPRLARCHPTRGLSETGQNLVEYMLEEVGLPKDAVLPNIRPRTTPEQSQHAEQLMRSFGGNVVFVHPFGGWGLKSIPIHIMADLADEIHKAGLKLVQIGGAGDRRMEHCDGAILENFMPSQWREILARGRALLGVDSWTAHFGAILDIPQICIYGSTHPKHVNTKRWFKEQASRCLVLEPIVNCSPCNSLTCLAFPERKYCTGYAVDRTSLRLFLSNETPGVRAQSTAHRL